MDKLTIEHFWILFGMRHGRSTLLAAAPKQDELIELVGELHEKLPAGVFEAYSIERHGGLVSEIRKLVEEHKVATHPAPARPV